VRLFHSTWGGQIVSRSLSRLQALVLGVVIFLGLSLGAAGLFAVGSRGWFGKDALEVRVGFPEIRGVEVGTRVRIQGIDAGEVVRISPPEEPDAPVLLHLRLKGEFRRLVRVDSAVRIVSEGMIGGKVLEIHRRPRASGGTAPDEPAADGALLTGESSQELNDVLGQVGDALKGIQTGEGTLGKLARDQQAYDALVNLLTQGKDTLTSIQQDADAVKRLPIVNRYVEDTTALLVRPHCERPRQYFAEEELFEPRRAVLTAQGKQRLDTLAPWLEGMKHKGSDVVIVAYADPKAGTAPSLAQAVTRHQSDSVCDYLLRQHAVQKMGWFSSRKVTPLGMGIAPPPSPETQPLPPARVEVQVFIPQH
jgi:phospholipid/cholesterol/gamma-HCH transport system substrate-binding protein